MATIALKLSSYCETPDETEVKTRSFKELIGNVIRLHRLYVYFAMAMATVAVFMNNMNNAIIMIRSKEQ